MVHVEVIAATFLAFLSQDPAPVAPRAGRADQPILHAEILPKSTLAALTLHPFDSRIAELERTGLWKLLKKLELPADLATAATELQGRATRATGMDTAQLRALAGHGVTIAWTGLDAKRAPHFLVAVGAARGDTTLGETLARAMEKQRARGTPITSELCDKHTLWCVRTPENPTIWALADDERLLLATSAQLVTEAVGRRRERTASLASEPRFIAWRRQIERETNPLLAGYFDLPEIMQTALRQQATPARQLAAQWLSALHLGSLGALGFATRASGGELHDTWRLCLPVPRAGLLPCLFGEGARVRASIANLIPPEAKNWSILHLDPQRIAQESLALLSLFQPSAATAFDTAVRGLGERTGVDLERDILANLGPQIVCLQWPAEPTLDARASLAQPLALLVETRNALRVAEALARILQQQRVRTTVSQVAGQRVHRFSASELAPGMEPCFFVGDSHLIVASSTRAMAATLRQIQAPARNTPVESFLGQLPEGATTVSVSDFATVSEGLVSQLAARDAELLGSIPELLATVRGTLRSILSTDPEGVTLRSSSPVGAFSGLLLVGVGASVALPALLGRAGTIGAAPGGAGARRSDATHELALLVALVHDAQQAWRASAKKDQDRDGEPEYGTITELVAAGLVDRERLGTNEGDDTFQTKGYRLKLLLPRSRDEQERHFAVVAWPAERRTGLVFGANERLRCMQNDLIARALGITVIDPRDIYLDGSFAKQLVSGWKELPLDLPTRAASPAKAIDGDRELALVLERAAKAPRGTTPPDLLAYLSHENTDWIARAAFRLGELQAQDAVPKLAENVARLPDGDARRQCMAALMKLADPRARQTATSALGSNDPQLRAFAAATLGKLGSKDAIDPLLAMLSATKERPGPDRVQALTALADLGDARCLLGAASAVQTGDTSQDAALAFLFQSLSGKLARDDESKHLMAVLAHPCGLLRRYAIQRLGEMRDPNALPALEGRLAKEDKSLRPLVEVALAAIRGKSQNEPAPSESPEFLATLTRKARATWGRMDTQERAVACAIPVVLVIALVLVFVTVARRRRQQNAEAWAARVAPSDDFVQDVESADAEVEGAEPLEYEEAGAEAPQARVPGRRL